MTRLHRNDDLLEALRQREPAAAVQDALWTAVRNIDSFRRECAFGSWLFRIVANAAYHKRRYRQSRRREMSWNEILRDFDEQSRYIMPTAHWSSRVNDPAVQKELWLPCPVVST